jgi:hypothetical protein
MMRVELKIAFWSSDKFQKCQVENAKSTHGLTMQSDMKLCLEGAATQTRTFAMGGKSTSNMNDEITRATDFRF